MTDDAIVNSVVREEGIVALASPPSNGWGPVITWVMPGLVLALGFFVYTAFVRRNRKTPIPISATDEALIERYRGQMDRELDDEPKPGKLR